MGVNIGIDLGTTYSVTAWINPITKLPEIIKNENGHMITPSVIHFTGDGKYECGEDAKEAFEDNEPYTASAFKRFMGTKEICCSAYGHDYTAYDLSAILLKYLKEQAEDTLGQKVDGAVITVPAYFHNKEREDTLNAGKAAGLNVLGIIHEPTAAAMCYGVQKWRENAIIMVYDLGGGTFDVTLVGMGKDHRLESLCTDGDHKLGGKDWDEKLAGLVMKKIQDEYQPELSREDETELLNKLRSSAEGWKKELSKQSASVTCKVRVKGCGLCSVVVTREEFDRETEVLLDMTGGKCEAVLYKKGLTWENITDVLLVGGSTRMPQVRDFLANKRGGKEPISHVNPDEAVALGAAIQTAAEGQEYKILSVSKGGPKDADELKGASLVMRYSGPVGNPVALSFASISARDVQAHGMGIVAVDEKGTAYVNENIVPPNTSFPVKYAKGVVLHTSPTETNEMEVFVLEGTEKQPGLNVYNAKYVVSGIRHEKDGALIRVQYSYDRNGIIHVQARQGTDDYDLPIREEEVTDEDRARFDGPVERTGGTGEDCTLIMSLDVSGSMAGAPIENAKGAMIEFVNQFRESGAKIGAQIVSDSNKWIIHPTDKYDQCINKIQSIKCGETGYGNLTHPFEEIYSELSSVSGTRYAIVLADGVWCRQENAIAKAKKCHGAGIEICGMGFGYADKDFINAISSRSDLSMFTKDSSGLGACFGKIAQVIGTGSKKGTGGSAMSSTAATWKTKEE